MHLDQFFRIPLCRNLTIYILSQNVTENQAVSIFRCAWTTKHQCVTFINAYKYRTTNKVEAYIFRITWPKQVRNTFLRETVPQRDRRYSHKQHHTTRINQAHGHFFKTLLVPSVLFSFCLIILQKCI